MNKTRLTAFILWTALIVARQAAFPAPPPAAAKPLVVAATIFPVADMVRRGAGDAARVIQILPAGASPHTFDLTPGTIRELQQARVIFKIGVIDDWIDGVAESAPAAEIVSLQGRIALRPSEDGSHDHGAGKARLEAYDPHYWLAARNGIIMVQGICAKLSAVDPARAALYAGNSRRYQQELLRLDDELKKDCAVLKNRALIVFHDGWRYFAAAYGLEVLAVFEPSPGREPAPRDLQKLYALARTRHVKAVFSEPQLPIASLEPLLEDMGLRLFILDPLGGAVAGDSYAGLLRRNVRSIVRADAP
jgi:ABC-type Zn uptake system ZnuABC Zn-binding protein ZnuA